MRHPVISLFLLPALLAACSPQDDVQLLQPEEVLRNAAQASMQMESVRYELQGEFVLEDGNGVRTDGTVVLDGVLQDRGEQIQFDAEIAATTAYPAGDTVLSANAGVVVSGPQDVYVRLEEFASDGPVQFFNDQLTGQFAGRWWRIPSREDQASAVSVSPDPRLLNAQAQVVNVVRDRGVATLRGRRVYRYDVSVDTDKLVAYLRQVAAERNEPFDETAVRASVADMEADGELWIDAETFNVRRLRWDIAQRVTDSGHSLQAVFTVDFFEHNSAEPVVIPQDATDFTPLMFFDAPVPVQEGQPELPPEVEEEILQQILDQGTANPYTQ